MSDETPKAPSSIHASTFPTWTFDTACPSMEWTPLCAATCTLQAQTTVEDLTADLVIVGVDATLTTGGRFPFLADVDASLTGGALAQVWEEHEKALRKPGAISPTIRVGSKAKAMRFVLLGLGSSDTAGGAVGGSVLGKAIAAVGTSEKKIASLQVVLPANLATQDVFVMNLVTGIYESLYTGNNRFRRDKKPVAEELLHMTLLSPGDAVCDASAVERGRQLATGILLAKDIVNAPHNVLNSESLAETAQRIAAASPVGNLTCTILDKKACEARGMGAYLGVARGSETQPQFIHLVYRPPSKGDADAAVLPKVALVGKGVLFDTGGYNIKTQMMEMM
jgi:leucyl aminopeptidase